MIERYAAVYNRLLAQLVSHSHDHMIIQLPYVHNHDGTSKQIEEQTNLKSFYVEIAAEITPQNKKREDI
jgi:hypothetical protein